MTFLGEDENYSYSSFRVIQKGKIGKHLETTMVLGPNDKSLLESQYKEFYYSNFVIKGLSGGQIAGIVIGIIVAVILICILNWRYRTSIRIFISWLYSFTLWRPR